MDFSLKKRRRECCRDRLSNLPKELICQILSSLPTKDAAMVSLSSKKMRRTFMYLTTLDFNDSRRNSQLVERFQIFKSFVNNVLLKSKSPYLSKFRLRFGRDSGKQCFPVLEATKLNSWIGFPLSRCGVKEIDLRIHVREPGNLPSALFTCETLEVLKLHTNLGFKLVSSMPSFRLPNLKVLQLHSIILPEDDFVGRLVSNCLSLQELSIDCKWKYGKSVVISSPSLQKLVLLMNKNFAYDSQCELLNIDTPNLQYFECGDILAFNNSFTTMKALVQASIIYNIDCDLVTSKAYFRIMLNIVQAVCKVQHLSLTSSCVELLDYEDLKDQLPTFQNLKHLEFATYLRKKWDDKVLFEFLRRSPVLEILEFPDGIDPWHVIDPEGEFEKMKAERRLSKKNQASPYSFKTRLKRIVIKYYCGTIREFEFLRSLLRNAPALEELLIICDSGEINPVIPESTWNKLRMGMASSTCLLTVQ